MESTTLHPVLEARPPGRSPGPRYQLHGFRGPNWFAGGAGAAVSLAFVLSTGLGAESLHFTDVTDAAGLRYVQHEAAAPPDCLVGGGIYCEPERMSGGAAAGDVDGDGWVDLYATRLHARDLLFRNLGDGTFRDVAEGAGLASYNIQSNGVALADVDNDGDLDLFLTVIGDPDEPINSHYYLFINDGAGRFEEEALSRGVALDDRAIHIGFGAAFGDYDLDGWLDLHVTEWIPGYQSGQLSHNRLFRNLGANAPGHFEDVTRAAGVTLLDPDVGCAGEGPCGSWGFASAFTDLDDDGFPDLAVTADFGTSRIFWNEGDGTFTDGTGEAGVGTDENGMGSAFGDFDGDGDLDWFVTSVHDPEDTCRDQPCRWGATGNRLYANEGRRRFADVTDAAGVRHGYFGWGAVPFDADNDGDLDLAMVNGVEFPHSERSLRWRDDPMRFWVGDGKGAMSEVSESVGLTDRGSGKGLLTFDYDRDGDLDLFLVNNAGSPRLYRNDGTGVSDYLRVDVEGRESNRQGLGARVTVHVTQDAEGQVREIGTAGHFLAQSETTAHFGLGVGTDPVWRVTVTWPRTGYTRELRRVPRNSTVKVTEPRDSSGGQIPGDCDQDGRLALGDGLCLLHALFVDASATLPCGVGGLRNPGNQLLLDANGDAAVTIADAVTVFGHLFLGTSTPALGTECLPIEGCPEVCG